MMNLKSVPLILLLCLTTNSVFAQKNRRLPPTKKGDFRLLLKLPHFNYLAFNPNQEFRDAELGFNGYGIGSEYSYSDNRFLEASASWIMTFEWPFPVPLDAEYNKILSSGYFNVTDNFIKNRFRFGYGLSYSMNTWNEWTRDFENWNGNFDSIGVTTYQQMYTNRNFGLTFNAFYRLGKTAHVGVIYQPSILNINKKPELIYEHLISLEFNWKFRLFGRDKKDSE